MKRRIGFVVVAGTLLVGTTAATQLSRPFQMARRTVPWAAPAVPTVAPRGSAGQLLPLPGRKDFTAAPAPKPRKPGPDLAQVPERQSDLPPSTVLVDPRPAPGPGPSLAVVPQAPAPRPGPNLAAAASTPLGFPSPAEMTPVPFRQPPPMPNLAAVPEGLPADPSGTWKEKETDREQPELRVYNYASLSGQLLLTKEGKTRRVSWNPADGLIHGDVDPGEYRYEVRGPIFRRSGRPDMAGTLRCRKFRLYEMELFWRPGLDTQFRDYGDRP